MFLLLLTLGGGTPTDMTLAAAPVLDVAGFGDCRLGDGDVLFRQRASNTGPGKSRDSFETCFSLFWASLYPQSGSRPADMGPGLSKECCCDSPLL